MGGFWRIPEFVCVPGDDHESGRDSDRGHKGNVVAESRLIDVVKGADGYVTGYIIDEVHYEPGKKQIFRAKSVIDLGGQKVREIESSGKKQKEYYFIWADPL